MNLQVSTNNYHQIHFTPQKNRDRVWAQICAYLQKFVPKDATVLDLGSGYGNFINLIHAREKTAIDIWPEFKSHLHKNIKAIVYDLSAGLPKTNKRFDVIFASNFLEHLNAEAIDKVLDDVKKALKQNGKLILIQPNFKYSYKNYFDDYTHRTVFTDVSLPNLLIEKGFRIIKVEPKFIPFSFKSNLPTNEWLVKLYLRLPQALKILSKQMLVIVQKEI